MTNVIAILLLFMANIQLYGIDIIQLDVGNARTLVGILNIKSNLVVHPSNHGTTMVEALLSELKRQKSKPVTASQLAWTLDGDSRNSLLRAMFDSIAMHPSVLSLSFGGGAYDPEEAALLRLHTNNDTVIVAAAGNENGKTIYYPASYANACILSVGTLSQGKRAFYSNFGTVWLEYQAGDPVGTSASTARMAGIVLQVRRAFPELDCAHIVYHVKVLYGRKL